jgi:hypothetical protein
MLNKLDFKNYGDCYSYIHYNVPDLETVLKNELTKLKEISKIPEAHYCIKFVPIK